MLHCTPTTYSSYVSPPPQIPNAETLKITQLKPRHQVAQTFLFRDLHYLKPTERCWEKWLIWHLTEELNLVAWVIMQCQKVLRLMQAGPKDKELT